MLVELIILKITKYFKAGQLAVQVPNSKCGSCKWPYKFSKVKLIIRDHYFKVTCKFMWKQGFHIFLHVTYLLDLQ